MGINVLAKARVMKNDLLFVKVPMEIGLLVEVKVSEIILLSIAEVVVKVRIATYGIQFTLTTLSRLVAIDF